MAFKLYDLLLINTTTILLIFIHRIEIGLKLIVNMSFLINNGLMFAKLQVINYIVFEIKENVLIFLDVILKSFLLIENLASYLC